MLRNMRCIKLYALMQKKQYIVLTKAVAIAIITYSKSKKYKM